MNHKKIIKHYYQAFQDADKEALRATLTVDLNHISDFKIYTNRDDMIEEIWPSVGKTRAVDLQIFGTYPEYMVRYKVTGAEKPARNMSEYIRFNGDKITEIEVFMGREVD